MTSANEKPSRSTNHYAPPLAEADKSTILVPLIIGGAIVAAAFLLWNSHATKARIARTSALEESVRQDLREAYRELRAFRPARAYAHTETAQGKMDSLRSSKPTDYPDLQAALLMLSGEALLMLNPAENATATEEQFSAALSSMTRASGVMWEFGMFGRGRARLEGKRYREAEEDFNRLLERNASFGAAYYWRSLAREAMGDAEGAGADAVRAKKLDSWPPLRDIMRASPGWNRDFLCDPEVRKR